MNRTNPNGANQYSYDPRQKLCWDYYINPKSKTFGNATQSAIKAGYTSGTANTITTTEWFIGKLWKLNSVNKAEETFKKILELPAIDENNRVDSGVLRIQADIAKFLASTQGKDEGYSTRSEVTGKDGEALNTFDEKQIKTIASLVCGNGADGDSEK